MNKIWYNIIVIRKKLIIRNYKIKLIKIRKEKVLWNKIKIKHLKSQDGQTL